MTSQENPSNIDIEVVPHHSETSFDIPYTEPTESLFGESIALDVEPQETQASADDSMTEDELIQDELRKLEANDQNDERSNGFINFLKTTKGKMVLGAATGCCPCYH